MRRVGSVWSVGVMVGIYGICGGLLVGAAAGCNKKTDAPIGRGPAPSAGAMSRAEPTASEARAEPAGAPARLLGERAARDKAMAVTALLAKGKYDKVAAAFSPQVRAALPAPKLKALWEKVQSQVGAYQSHQVVKSMASKGARTVVVRVRFARAQLDLIWSLGSQGEVGGLHLQSVTQPGPAWAPPPYAQASQIREIPVTVGKGPRALPGVLTLPAARGGKRLPALVLVHGSGPQDRDETIGPNKVFKDLAWGLAAKGIAVLRYDKVTKAKPALAKGWMDRGVFTADKETTEDALAAVALLRRRPEVQPTRIFLLGHSQGGYLGPRAASRAPKLAGLILMAGPTRPLEDLVLAQFRYIAGAKGPQAAAMAKLIPKMVKAVALVKSPKLSPKTPTAALPLGIPASFWLGVRGYRPAQVAAHLKMPILVIQGEADYQVTLAEDFAGWKRALGKRKGVTFKRYPHLGHTFIDLKKKMAMPADYMKVRGHVAPQVIDDIAAFVRSAR